MDSDRAFKHHQVIREITNGKNKRNIVLGKYLHEMRETKDYQLIAGEDMSFGSYLADPELGLSPASAYRYMRVYEKYILDLQLKEEVFEDVDVYKLDMIRKEVDLSNLDEWLDRARALSRSDLNQVVKYKDKDVMTCNHNYIYHAKRCTECGDTKYVRGES